MSKNKGESHEQTVQALYERWGYRTWRPRKSRMVRGASQGGVDIFGAFDIIAVTPQEVALIQVSTRGHGSKAQDVQAFSLVAPACVRCSFWIYRARRKVPVWEVWEYHQGSVETFEVDNDGDMREQQAE